MLTRAERPVTTVHPLLLPCPAKNDDCARQCWPARQLPACHSRRLPHAAPRSCSWRASSLPAIPGACLTHAAPRSCSLPGPAAGLSCGGVCTEVPEPSYSWAQLKNDCVYQVGRGGQPAGVRACGAQQKGAHARASIHSRQTHACITAGGRQQTAAARAVACCHTLAWPPALGARLATGGRQRTDEAVACCTPFCAGAELRAVRHVRGWAAARQLLLQRLQLPGVGHPAVVHGRGRGAHLPARRLPSRATRVVRAGRALGTPCPAPPPSPPAHTIASTLYSGPSALAAMLPAWMTGSPSGA